MSNKWTDCEFLTSEIKRIKEEKDKRILSESKKPHTFITKYRIIADEANRLFRPEIYLEGDWFFFDRWEVMKQFQDGSWYTKDQCLRAILKDVDPKYFDDRTPSEKVVAEF